MMIMAKNKCSRRKIIWNVDGEHRIKLLSAFSALIEANHLLCIIKI